MKTDIKFFGYLVISLAILVLLLCLVVTGGCISLTKETIKEALKTPTPTPTPIPTTLTPRPTPTPTPAAIPGYQAHPVDPYAPGERYENQWFKWRRADVEGLKDLHAGVIVYRHAFLDYYTWYNNALGNYQIQEPTEGSRYFVAWIHEEILETNKSAVTSMWLFDEGSFHLQIKGVLIDPDTVHNPVNRILELDTKYDYYNTVRTDRFGWQLIRSLTHKEYGGYYAQKIGWIRAGPGNSADGFILFEIPEDTLEKDILLLGDFADLGSAYWRFL